MLLNDDAELEGMALLWVVVMEFWEMEGKKRCNNMCMEKDGDRVRRVKSSKYRDRAF